MSARQRRRHGSIIRSRSITIMRSGATSTTNIGRLFISSMPQGRIRHHQFGEGEYEQSELIIQQLLTEAGKSRNVSHELVSVDPKRY